MSQPANPGDGPGDGTRETRADSARDVAGPSGEAGPPPYCYRHPTRETYIRCQRCGRYICPDCMRQASVGYQCPECVAAGAATTRLPRTPYGGSVSLKVGQVSKVLIAINVAITLLIWATGSGRSIVYGQLVEITRSELLPGHGIVTGIVDGGYWRLISAAFVHVQPFHLLLNMYALWVFGPFLESLLGRTRFIAVYLTCALAGGVAVYWFENPFVPTLGASGAIFGLFGAALVIMVRRRMNVQYMLGLLGLNLLITFLVPHISWQGHLGGLVAGLLLGAMFVWAPRAQRTLVHIAGFALVIGVCVVLVVARTSELTTAAGPLGS